jgi:hypothetical protein
MNATVDRAAVAAMSTAELVRAYNQIPGVKPVKRFSDKKEGQKRVLAALDAAQGGEKPATKGQATPAAKPAPVAGEPGTKPHTILARTGEPKLPRPGSKRGQLLEALRTPKGISVEEMVTRFAWTARDCGDALRLLAKQNGVGVARGADGRWRVAQ